MNFRWIRYKSGSGNKYSLVLVLGEQAGRIYLLDCKSVPNSEAAIIKATLPALAKLSLKERINWTKQVCPVSYRLAFKTMLLANVTTVIAYE